MEGKKKTILIVSVCVAAVIIIAAAYFFNASRKGVTDGGEAVQTQQPAPSEGMDDAASQSPEDTAQADNKAEASKQTEQSSAEPEKVYTPTFMYFVSSKDDGFENTNKMLEELKKEYSDKITFDIRNIDEDPETVKNFPVEGNTPTLIMLNTKNDICAFLFKCSDKEQLKQEIEKALE